MQGRNRPWIKAWALACGLVLQALVLVPQHAGAQNRDPNAPFRDAYDVQYGRRLVGSWSGTISGSSVSQADGQMEGQAVFMRRGYEGRDDFGLILHDHRHRDDQTFSEIGINSIPCGPSPGVTRAIHPIEVQNAGGGYATALFINRLARAPAGFQAFPAYGPELDSPATVETEWTEDTFTLRLSGPMISGVLPVRENGTFDYERQREGELDEIHLSAEFTLERTPETADLFDRTLCEQKDFIQVVETLPESGRENVVLEGANFYIEFDTDIERTTLDETTVFMTTRNPGGGPIFVATELSLVSPDRVEVSPTEPLLWGTVYDIEVVSGENGLRGRDEEMLERDFSFSISTLVDPEDIRLEIHQVSRDAPLVHGKPAAGRIFVEWEERDDVHPAWQVLNYPVVAEIRDNRDEPVFPELSARVRRPDLLSDEDRRLGEHSLNLFDWTPTPGASPTEFTATVRPENPYPETAEPEPESVDHTMEYAARHSELLVFDYYIAEHAEWADGADDRTKHYVLLAAQHQQTFMNQIFPIARVVGRYQGSYNIARLLCELPSEVYSCAENEGDLMALFQLFYEHISARSVAQVIVSYHPSSLGGTGRTYAPFDQPASLIARPGEASRSGVTAPELGTLRRADRENRNMIVMSTSPLPDGVIPGLVTTPLIEHEFGHVFALPHTPYVDDGEHRRAVCDAFRDQDAAGIDGMRIALDGTIGWQKSTEDGNAQSTGPMRNLMFPCAFDPRAEYWINADQYDWLLDNMPAILRNAGAHTGSLDYWELSQAPLGNVGDDVTTSVSFQGASDEQWVMLSGVSDGTRADLLPAASAPGPRDPIAGHGPYEIRVEDAAGQVLAQAPVGPGPDEHGLWPFAVRVAVSGEPARIVLLDGETVMAERHASPGLARPAVRSHASGSVFRAGDALAWDAGAGEDLTYTVRFTPDGRTWSTLAVFLTEPRFVPDPQTIRPGSEAAFEIVAHDGVRERATRLPVSIEAPLTPLVTWSDADEAGQGAPAGAAFNVEIDAGSLDAVTLEADGVPVPARVSLSPSGTILSIAPRDPEAGRAYTAIVGRGLRAADGRTLDEEIRLAFAIDAGEPVSERPAWDPERRSMMGAGGSADTAPQGPDAEPEQTAPQSRSTAEGEITLGVRGSPTIPATIIRCDVEDGVLLDMGVVFETNPGSRIEVSMRRTGDAMTSEMYRSDGYRVGNRGGAAEGWDMSLTPEGALSARGKAGGDEDGVDFTLTGECPPQP